MARGKPNQLLYKINFQKNLLDVDIQDLERSDLRELGENPHKLF